MSDDEWTIDVVRATYDHWADGYDEDVDSWGYRLPDEVSAAPYVHGAVGMALAGPDTGGSQWFLTHRATPHLDGRYSIFGRIEKGFDVLDALVQGDVILGIDFP